MNYSKLLPLAGLLAAILAFSGWVHGREQLAVARAQLHSYIDSTRAIAVRDSIESARRDSAAAQAVAQLQVERARAVRAEQRARASADSAQGALDSATSVQDSVLAYQKLVTAKDKQIEVLGLQLTQADSSIAILHGEVHALQNDLLAVRASNAALLTKLNEQTRVKVLDSTPFRAIEAGLAVYGGIRLVRG